ncbi:MAG: murein L,D-transpeptidase [Nocardioides sp.]|nr:murein L,D-transpeptidase [Nocardioides sp.]
MNDVLRRRGSGSRGSVHRVLVVLGLVLAVVASLSVTTAPPASASARWTLRAPFSREIVRPGDVDKDPYRIAHVYEVQYRLRRVGLFDADPTGYFGSITEAGVKSFQKRNGLAQTGIVNHRTWRRLIRQSVRGRRAVPDGCTKAGWHACYDRRRHQVNLYHRGRLLNSWLVRGGGASTPTRTGRFRVYYRDIDHVSTLFDTPMPYSQFFSGGQALHGSRLMMDPYVGHSHGCVNFWTEDARQLWRLTSTRRLWVHVYGKWS